MALYCGVRSLRCTHSCGGFSLAPSEGERAGERGCSVASIPRSWQYLVNPLGIDVGQPRLSWVLADEGQRTKDSSRRRIKCWWRQRLSFSPGNRPIFGTVARWPRIKVSHSSFVIRRITITLDPIEADIVRQRCQDYDIGPTQMFRTFLRLELRFGLLRKEVTDLVINLAEK